MSGFIYVDAPRSHPFFSPFESSRKFPSGKVVQVAIRAIGAAIGAAIDQAKGSPSAVFGKLSESFTAALEALDERGISFRVMRYGFYGIRIPFIYLEYFIHDAIHDTTPALIGNVLYLLGELGNLAKWGHELKIIDLAPISSGLGKIKFFSKLSELKICPIDASLNILGGVASLLYSLDYLIKLSKGRLSRQEKIAVWAGLFSCVIHMIAIGVFFQTGEPVIALTVLSVLSYMGYWGLRRYPIKALQS